MHTGPFTKVYSNIIYSTVWQEPPEVRCVWIAMLMLADQTGYVGASIPGLASAAKVDLEWVEKALQIFKEPDEYSRTKAFDGRRIEEVDGGWRILNYVLHRDGSEEQREVWRQQKAKQRAREKSQEGPGEQAYGRAVGRGNERTAEAILEESVKKNGKKAG